MHKGTKVVTVVYNYFRWTLWWIIDSPGGTTVALQSERNGFQVKKIMIISSNLRKDRLCNAIVYVMPLPEEIW